MIINLDWWRWGTCRGRHYERVYLWGLWTPFCRRVQYARMRPLLQRFRRKLAEPFVREALQTRDQQWAQAVEWSFGMEIHPMSDGTASAWAYHEVTAAVGFDPVQSVITLDKTKIVPPDRDGNG